MQLRGRVVVVTGASAGIGEVTAVAFAKRGAKVVLAARRTERLDELADRIHRAGGSALALTVDVGDPKQLDRLPGVIHEAVGPVDVLVNNAGMPGRGEFDSLPYEQIEKVVRVNLLGVLFGSRAFARAALGPPRCQSEARKVDALAKRSMFGDLPEDPRARQGFANNATRLAGRVLDV